MKKTYARGRLFPQSYSTDRRVGKISMKAWGFYCLMWSNADDQGRLTGQAEELKYGVCPNRSDISEDEIPDLLDELQRNKLITLYPTPLSIAVQMLDWWDVNRKLQWAWPSEFPPPEGWRDRLRYKRGRTEVVTFNWSDEDSDNGEQLSLPTSKERESIKEKETNYNNKIKEENKRGRGKSPECSGETSGELSPETNTASNKPSPPLTGIKLSNQLRFIFPQAFGRQPDSREVAQLGDLGKEISSAGGATAAQVYDAFKEAATHNVLQISYVRKVLQAWLGLERGPPR